MARTPKSISGLTSAAAARVMLWQSGEEVTVPGDAMGLQPSLGFTPLNAAAVSAYMLTLLDDANAATARATLGIDEQRRNRIVNGAMQISQEHGDASSINGYSADQWTATTSIATVTAARTTVLPESGTRALYTNIVTAKPSLAAGDYWQWAQYIEGLIVSDFLWGTADAKQVILRFMGWTDQAGTYTASVKNSAQDRVYLAPFTLPASTWTEVIIVIPGDTTGTWLKDTGKGVIVNISLAAGTTYGGGTAGWGTTNKIQITGNTNGAAAANKTFYFRDFGLYLDDLLTGIPPRWEMPDYAEELMACQRYFEGVTGVYHANVWGAAYYKVTKRVVPSIAFSTAPSGGSGVTDGMIFASHNATISYTFVADARM